LCCWLSPTSNVMCWSSNWNKSKGPISVDTVDNLAISDVHNDCCYTLWEQITKIEKKRNSTLQWSKHPVEWTIKKCGISKRVAIRVAIRLLECYDWTLQLFIN
jgi:hypothetical protein